MLGLACVAATAACGRRGGPPAGFAAIPAGTAWLGSAETAETHPPRRAEFPDFWLGRAPVTVAEYAAYLNDVGAKARAPDDPAFERVNGRWRAARGRARHPAAGIARADAEAYCEWLGQRLGLRARLPTADEWEYAARGGIDGGRYPWGWGRPESRAPPATDGPRPVGRGTANTFGVTDLVGHVFQWCADTDGEGRAIACGGSWAERDPRFLRVFQRTPFPADYRGRDVGFRALIERPGP